MPPRRAASAKPAAPAATEPKATKANASKVTKPAAKATKAAPKKAAPKKAAAPKDEAAVNGVNGVHASDDDKPAKAPKKTTAKRKADADESDVPSTSSARPIKRARTASVPAEKPKAAAKPKPAPKPKKTAQQPVINKVPSAKLDVFVFGEGSSGELGLGSRKYDGKLKPIDVKRPRINRNLEKAGVVQVACGGMHVVALTADNKVLTWGVNDDKALGRDTNWEGGVRDVDDESDSDDEDDTGINPRESTPTEINYEGIPEGTVFTQVAATDSASFVVTDEGDVYGWGTFRGADGIIGFSADARTQPTPSKIAVKAVKKLACGSNHVIALDKAGKVWTWGAGGQYQLGRRIITRHSGATAGLKPELCSRFGAKKYAVDVAAGSYHSFFLDNHGQVWAWGLNNFSQTGHESVGEDDAMVLEPAVVESLSDLEVKQIAGGEHHSVACTKSGKLLTWGRIDGHQVGQPSEVYTEDNAVFDENKRPRILFVPTEIKDIKASFVATGTDTSFAITEDGEVHSWGFSANYQTGQGTTDDVETPERIENTAVKDRKITWAGAGGQYSMVGAVHEESQVNGTA